MLSKAGEWWEVQVFWQVGSVLNKEGNIEDEILERVQQRRRAAGSIRGVLRNREVSM